MNEQVNYAKIQRIQDNLEALTIGTFGTGFVTDAMLYESGIKSTVAQHTSDLADSQTNINGRGINLMNPPTPLVAPVGDYNEETGLGTDDTVAIQTIINSLNIGDTLIIPNKKFRITSTIILSKPINIVGSRGGSKFVCDMTSGAGISIESSSVSITGLYMSQKTRNFSNATTGISIGKSTAPHVYSYLSYIFLNRIHIENFTTSIEMDAVYWLEFSLVSTKYDRNGIKINKRSGTGGVLNGGNTTGTISSGSSTLIVNNATGLVVGQFIKITGVSGVKQITAINGTTITLDIVSDANVTNAVVSYSDLNMGTTHMFNKCYFMGCNGAYTQTVGSIGVDIYYLSDAEFINCVSENYYQTLRAESINSLTFIAPYFENSQLPLDILNCMGCIIENPYFNSTVGYIDPPSKADYLINLIGSKLRTYGDRHLNPPTYFFKLSENTARIIIENSNYNEDNLLTSTGTSYNNHQITYFKGHLLSSRAGGTGVANPTYRSRCYGYDLQINPSGINQHGDYPISFYVQDTQKATLRDNFELIVNGGGIIFKSPDGLTKKKLTIDNSGNAVWTTA